LVPGLEPAEQFTRHYRQFKRILAQLLTSVFLACTLLVSQVSLVQLTLLLQFTTCVPVV
jgi:hypothetical protein